jgi:Putative phage tail protein
MPAIGAAIGAIVSSVGAAITALGPIGSLIVRLVVSVAASALMQALQPKPREPGIRTEVTQTGGTNPLSFVLMGYATGGARACPPMSHGSAGKTPNAYLTEVIELGDIAGQTLSRVIINDEYVTLGSTPHADYGLPVTGRYAGYAWVKYYNGTQTTADAMLLAKYGTYPERPWNADMIGRGLCYAIVTFRYKRNLWGSTVPPRLRFETGGIPLYDPRKDTTVGGSGAHRWANKATWEPTVNPMVAIYNIMRGIGLDDGSTWGGGIPASDLPLASWFAAMNACDTLVNNGAGGTEPQYRAGFEVAVDEQPADVIAELLKVCSGQLADVGGVWKARVGAVGVSVLSITDGDIVITSPQDYAPFPSFTSSFNGIHATYPEPGMLWEQKEAPPLYNATWEAQDQGQRLIANLGLPACPYGAQVRRIMLAYITEERRFRRHGHTLPPDCAVLEPLDAMDWTSSANGYSAKVFEISEVVDDPMTCLQQVSLRERDANDYVSVNPAPPALVSTLAVIPGPQSVPGFDAFGDYVPDDTGAPRRPALKLVWDGDQDDARGLAWEVRIAATGTIISRGSTHEVATGEIAIAEGILAATAYEARAILIADRDMIWTGWEPATTPAVLITRPDIADGAVSDQVQAISLGPYNKTAAPVNTVLASLATEIIAGHLWRGGVQMEARGGSVAGHTSYIEHQWRHRELGGAFTSWLVRETYTFNGASWDMQAGSFGLAGSYEEVQFRLVAFPSGSVGGSTDLFRNLYITLARVTK